MAPDSRVPVALVGGGTIAPLHAKYLTLSPTCCLVALIDPFEPGKILASSPSVPHSESVTALLASPVDNPDGYIICVPSSLHVKVATEVIICASPKAILIEKPIVTESQSATELLELAREKSMPNSCGSPSGPTRLLSRPERQFRMAVLEKSAACHVSGSPKRTPGISTWQLGALLDRPGRAGLDQFDS